jgi:predicted membrane channel-forming protein YqfA (hemolysin III family)
MADEQPDPRDESPDKRDDRNLAELLQELRVAGLGVQVLFGFLLAIPFATGFRRLGTAQRDLYITTVLLAVLATVLLLAPVAYHRIVFRQRQKEALVRSANVMAILGLIAVSLAICAAVALVLSYVAGDLPAILLTAITCGLFAGLWFAYPLARRR